MANTQVFNFGVASTVNPTDIFYIGQSGIEKALTLAVLSATLAAANPMIQTGYTQTTANFTQPAVAANVSVNVGTTAWMVAGQVLYVKGGGFYTVASIGSSTNVVLTNSGTTGNAGVGTTVATAAGIVFGGMQGFTGPTGPAAYTTTTAGFTQPAVGSTVAVTVASGAWAVAGQVCYVGTGGWYTIASISGNTLTLNNLGYPGNAAPAASVPTAQGVNPTGPIGASGLPAYTVTTASFTQPAGGSNVTVAMVTTAWMAVGQIVFVATGGYYMVASIGSNVSATLTNLNYSGNAAPATVIATAQAVNSAGATGSTGLPTQAGNAGKSLATDGTTTSWSFGGPWITKTANYTAIAGDRIKASTTGGAWSLTFPSSPNNSDTVELLDLNGTFDANNLTLLCAGGKTIMSYTVSWVLNNPNLHLIFTYDSTTGDWRI